MSIRSDLRHDGHRCKYCGRPLHRARVRNRELVNITEGEFADHRGTAVLVYCDCGIPSIVLWELTPPPTSLQAA